MYVCARYNFGPSHRMVSSGAKHVFHSSWLIIILK